MKHLAVGLAQHRATACGQHRVGTLAELIDRGLFQVAEGRFTLAIEVFPDGAAQPLFDDVV